MTGINIGGGVNAGGDVQIAGGDLTQNITQQTTLTLQQAEDLQAQFAELRALIRDSDQPDKLDALLNAAIAGTGKLISGWLPG